MLPRICRIPERRSCRLLGPRQTGKSSLLTGLLPRRAWTGDLPFERHGRLRLAAEIKAKRHVVGADVEGLRSFAEAHPGDPRAVVALVPEPYRFEGVEVLPFARFFERLGERL